MTFTETEFKAVSGWDNTDTLAAVSPQPASLGVIDPDIRKGGTGHKYGYGSRYCEWRYGFLTVAEWTALMTQLGGLSRTNKSANATIRTVLQDDFATYANFNAIAEWPEPDVGFRYRGGRYLDVVIVFTRLEAL